MRSQKTWLPAVHRIQVLRPLISPASSVIPPSMGAKTSMETWGKSATVIPAAFASSGGYCGERPHAAAKHSSDDAASIESPPRVSLHQPRRLEVPEPVRLAA